MAKKIYFDNWYDGKTEQGIGKYEYMYHKFQDDSVIKFERYNSQNDKKFPWEESKGYVNFGWSYRGKKGNLDFNFTKKHSERITDGIIYNFEGRKIDHKILEMAIEAVSDDTDIGNNPFLKKKIEGQKLQDKGRVEGYIYFVGYRNDEYEGKDMVTAEVRKVESKYEGQEKDLGNYYNYTGNFPTRKGAVESALNRAAEKGIFNDINNFKKELGVGKDYEIKTVDKYLDKEEIKRLDCYRYMVMNNDEYMKKRDKGLAFNGNRIKEGKIIYNDPYLWIKKLKDDRNNIILEKHGYKKGRIVIDCYEFKEDFNIASMKNFLYGFENRKKIGFQKKNENENGIEKKIKKIKI